MDDVLHLEVSVCVFPGTQFQAGLPDNRILQVAGQPCPSRQLASRASMEKQIIGWPLCCVLDEELWMTYPFVG